MSEVAKMVAYSDRVARAATGEAVQVTGHVLPFLKLVQMPGLSVEWSVVVFKETEMVLETNNYFWNNHF